MSKHTLHKHGFQIYKDSVEITDDIFNELVIQSDTSKVIFNHNKNNKNDKKGNNAP